MAQYEYFTSFGGIEVVADTEYTSNNIPSTMNAVKVGIGVRQKEMKLDDNGQLVEVEIPIRGLRVFIDLSGVSPAIPTPVTPVSTTYVIWEEGNIEKFVAGATYKFIDSGLVYWGIVEAL